MHLSKKASDNTTVKSYDVEVINKNHEVSTTEKHKTAQHCHRRQKAAGSIKSNTIYPIASILNA
jgi:hypothetical protein